jgi:hypothetical protein
MNRRDLLKQAGVLAVGLPALGGSGMAHPMPQANNTMDLVISFEGPFCFWAQEGGGYLVMAPPVGPGSGLAAHQGWIATHQNETQLGTTNGSAPEYTLEIPQVSGKAVTNPQFGGTKAFTHQQKGSKGNNYFFTLAVPAPNAIVGVRPTYAGVGSDSPQILAAGLIFVYNQVTLSGVQLQGGAQLFTPCFETDEKNFSAASLGIHFSRIDQSQDQGHGHAMAVWEKMISMYMPWMDSYRKICFPSFDITSCPPKVLDTACQATKPNQKGRRALFGPGNDCETPIMSFSTGGGNAAKPKK